MLDSDLVSLFRSDLQSGRCSSVHDFLAKRPVARDKSLVLDLAYEEFCLLNEQGQGLDIQDFCDRYPSYRVSLHRLLEVHSFIDGEWDADALQGGVEADDWPDPGDAIRGCTILRQLGRGAMAKVYLARNDDLDRLVAIKVCRSRSHEAKTLGRLAHPNIVYVDWVDELFDKSAICMTYEGAATLNDVLDIARAGASVPDNAMSILQSIREAEPAEGIREPCDPDRNWTKATYAEAIAGLVADICSGLEYAHAHGIIHGDLKPSNVSVTTRGTAKLLDFNLCLDSRYDTFRFGGTLAYMAPEHIEAVFFRNPSNPTVPRITEQSDIYSVGVLLWQLLSQDLPHDVPTPNTDKVAAARLLSLRCQPPFINPAVMDGTIRRLLKVARTCLEPSPQRRPPTARHVKDQILRCLPTQVVRRRSILAAGTLATIGGVSWASTSLRRNLLADGVAAIQQGRSMEAIAMLSDAVNQPDRYDRLSVLFARATAKRFVGDFQGALADYDQVRPLHPCDEVLMCCGDCHAMLGQFLNAQVRYEEVLRRPPISVEVIHNYAYCQLRLVQTSFRGAARTFSRNRLANSIRSQHLRLLIGIEAYPDDRDMFTSFAVGAASVLGRLIREQRNQQPRLHYNLARAFECQLQADEDAGVESLVQSHLQNAAEFGWPSNMIDPQWFARIADQAWFEALLRRPAGSIAPEAADLLFPPSTSARLSDFPVSQ